MPVAGGEAAVCDGVAVDAGVWDAEEVAGGLVGRGAGRGEDFAVGCGAVADGDAGDESECGGVDDAGGALGANGGVNERGMKLSCGRMTFRLRGDGCPLGSRLTKRVWSGSSVG